MTEETGRPGLEGERKRTIDALCEDFAADDPVFKQVWDQQNEFFRVWAGSSAITPGYTIYSD